MMKKNYTTGKLIVSKHRYELSIFILLMIKLFKHYISSENVLRLSLRFSVEMLMLVIASSVAGKIIRDSSEKIRETVLVLTMFLTISYASNSVLLLDNWFSGFEVFKNAYVVLCSLLIFLLIDKPKTKWVIPFLCFFAIAVQPFYTITFLPMVFILFVYKIRLGENRKESMDLFASTSIASVIAFLVFGIKIIPGVSHIGKEWLANLKITAFSIAIILPLGVLITAILLIARSKSVDKIFRRILTLIIFEPCVLLFTFFTVETNINLVMSAIFVQVCFILYFIQIKNPAIICACEKLNYFIDNNLFVILLSFIYMASISSFFKTLYVGMTRTKQFHSLWR